MLRAIAVVLAVVLSPVAAGAQVSPLWSSDEIRAHRPADEVEALAFDLHRQASGSGKRSVTTDQVVTLAPSFSLIAEGKQRVLDDHLLCRILAWKTDSATVDNQNCYAAAAFRDLEVRNRAVLGQMMAKIGPSAPSQMVYWGEAELGIGAPGAPANPLEVRTSGEGAEYRLDRAVVARFKGSAGEVSAEEMQRVTRFLAQHVNLHPQVRRGIAMKGRLPATIETETGPTKIGDGRQVITLSNLRRVRLAYPLPPGLESALAARARTGRTPRDLAIRRVDAVITGAAPRPSLEATIAQLRKASGAGHDLEAVMLLMELTQDYPAFFSAPASDTNAQAAISEVRALLRPRMAGPDAAAYLKANELAGDPKAVGDRQAAARFLALTPNLDALPFGTFRRVTYANLVASSEGTKGWDPAILKAMPADLVDNYWIHIASHPWAANAYKDAGDTYYRNYETPDAWIAFDLGRAVDPNWRAGVLGTVAKYEESLRTDQPDFF